MSIELMNKEFTETKAKWGENSGLVRRELLDAFGKASITRVVCFDVGLQPSVRYFAALMAILDALAIASIKYIAQNPVYTDVDKAFLRQYGYGIADYPDGIYHVDGNTLVFCVNPSTQTIVATSQGPQPAMLAIHDSICTPEIFANFDQHTLSLTNDPGNWSLYVRKASIGQHKYGLDTEIDYPEPQWAGIAGVMLHSELVGIASPLSELAAEALIRRNVAESVRQYGLDDERTLRASVSLADLLLKQNKDDEARVILRRILGFNMEKYGLYHILTLTSLGNRCLREKDLEMAEPLLRAVLRGLEEARGLDYDITAFAARELATVLFERKNYVESEGAFEKALGYFREKVPKEHRLENFITKGLYEGLMKAKMQIAEQAGSERNIEMQFAKLMEIEALAEESGIADRVRTNERR